MEPQWMGSSRSQAAAWGGSKQGLSPSPPLSALSHPNKGWTPKPGLIAPTASSPSRSQPFPFLCSVQHSPSVS